jgi:TetR/AcrR family transcriptional regulator
MMQLALPFKPFDTHALQMRRSAAVQFLGMALFTDRAHGASLANRVLADMPMPQPGNAPASTARPHARRDAL